MRLEKYGPDDRALFDEMVFNEKTMGMNLGRVFTGEEADMFFMAMLEQNVSDLFLGYYKVFVSRADGEKYIGMGALSRNDEYDAVAIEYMLLPKFWRQGYGTELAGLLVTMAAGQRAKTGIIAITDPANEFSQRILLKNGFTFVKEFVNCDGGTAALYRLPV